MQFALNSLRFEDVRQNIVDYLRENGKYTAQFDYAGSNLAYVIDAMAYANMLISYQLSLVANNMFLDTTEIRKNAVSIAKTLGYQPARKKASQFKLQMVYEDQNAQFQESDEIVIASGTVFKGEKLGHDWVNLSPIRLRRKSPTKLESDVATLWQGSFQEYHYFGTGESLQSFGIPSTGVENNNLTLYVKPTSGDDSLRVEWRHAQSFADISSGEIYFVEEDIVDEGTPKILFGNGHIGDIPSNTETVIARYLETKGSIGNGESGILLPEGISTMVGAGYDSSFINIVPVSTYSVGGTDHESLEEIKDNAPKYFTSAGRGVTANDFGVVLNLENDGSVQSFNVAGGDELFPGRTSELGRAYITAVPVLEEDFANSQSIYLSEAEEIQFIGKLRSVGIISTFKTFMKPTYVWLDLQPYIEVAPLTSEEERNSIFNEAVVNVKNYFKNTFDRLGGNFRLSKVLNEIDDTAGVLGSSLTIEHSFLINNESFYTNRVTRMFLPVIKEKDDDGNIVLDKNGLPVTQNFIKTNRQIVQEGIDERGEDFPWSVADLPPELSSLYGELTHRYSDRYLYNSDNYEVTLTDWWLISPAPGYTIISYKGNYVLDKNNVEYLVKMREDAAQIPGQQYTILLNDDTPVCTVYRVPNTDNTGYDDIHEWKIELVPGIEDFLDGLGFDPGEDNTYFWIEKIGGDHLIPGGNGSAKIEVSLLSQFEWQVVLDGVLMGTVRYATENPDDIEDTGWTPKWVGDVSTAEGDISDYNNMTEDDLLLFFDYNDETAEIQPLVYADNFDQILQVKGTLSGGRSAIKIYGKTKIFDIVSYTGGTANIPLTILYNNINSQICQPDENGKINFIYVDPEDNTTSSVRAFWISKNAEGHYITQEKNIELMNNMAFQSEVSFESYVEDLPDGTQRDVTAVYVYDIMHEREIGALNYFTGEMVFDSEFETKLSESTTEIITNRKYFDNYEDALIKFDTVRMIPVDLFELDGEKIGKATDFDASFNQFVVPDVKDPLVKKR